MIRQVKYLLVVLVLYGCSRLGSIDAEVGPYVASFRALAEHHSLNLDCDRITIKFQLLKPPTVGTCDSDGVIEIDPNAWRELSNDSRTVLIYHELGHCLLFREHTTAELTDGVPVSIMSPELLDPDVYQSHKDYYNDELFRP